MTDPAWPTATAAEETSARHSFGWVELLAMAILPVLAIVSIAVLAAKPDSKGEASSTQCWSQTVAQSEVGTVNVQLADPAGECITDEPVMSALAPNGAEFAMTLTYANIAPDSQDHVMLRVALPPGFEPGSGPVQVSIVSTDPVPGYQANADLWSRGLDLGTLSRGATATISSMVRVVGPAPEPKDDEVFSPIRINAGPAGDDPISDVVLVEWDEVAD